MSAEFVVAEFRVAPNKVSFRKACEDVAAESSIGTWTEVKTLTKAIEKRLSPKIVECSAKSSVLKVAYPLDLFELGNLPQLLSGIAGNVFGMKSVKGLRLQDIGFPKAYVKSFRGPKYGIGGVRKALKVKKRPLLGTIVKPKLGLNEKQHASVAFNAWLGGCDLVKDDENLTSMGFNGFEKRVRETLKKRDKAEKETRERKAYLANITAPFNEMVKRATFLEKQGCEYAMVDVVSVGWAALQELRQQGFDLILHGHRAGHAAFTRSRQHGISMLVLAKLCRLIGTDQLHIGAIVGKMHGAKGDVQAIGEAIESRIVRPDRKQHVLAENWLHLKPMFAVCSGGLHPGKVPALISAMGNDIVIQMGGGIHGHAQGTVAGAMAARQAVDAVMKGVSLKYYSENHPELNAALKKWKQ